MKRFGLLMVLCLFSVSASAKKAAYIYTDNRFNFVKLEELRKKETLEVSHPFTFTEEQMREILKGIKLNRSFVVKKEVETQDIFDERAVGFLAPKLVEAFLKAGARDKIVFSYLTKDNKFVLRDDRLTLGSAWVHGTELHIIFDKLFAKIMGDYDKRGDFSKIVARSRGLRVSLDVGEGQQLGDSVDELIVDTTHNFAGAAAETPVERP